MADDGNHKIFFRFGMKKSGTLTESDDQHPVHSDGSLDHLLNDAVSHGLAVAVPDT